MKDLDVGLDLQHWSFDYEMCLENCWNNNALYFLSQTVREFAELYVFVTAINDHITAAQS